MIKKNLVGTIRSSFEIGGLLLKDSAGVLQVRDPDDTQLKNVQAKAPLIDDDLVTREFLPPQIIRYFLGCVSGPGVNQTKDASFGPEILSTGGFVAIYAGEIVGCSVALARDRTAGVVTFYCTINGVTQNASGYGLVIDATNPHKNKLVYPAPISYSAGDELSMRSIAVGFSPSDSNCTIALFLRDFLRDI